MLTTKKRGLKILNIALSVFGLTFILGCTPPGPRAFIEGERLLKAGQYAPAIVQLKKATALLPLNAQAWNHLGLAFHNAGQAADAAQCYRRALDLDSNLATAHYNFGCLLLEQNNPVLAVNEFSSYVVFHPDSMDGWLKLGIAQLKARQYEAADKSLRYVAANNKKQVDALNGVGAIYVYRNRPREAYQYFAWAMEAQPDYRPALLNMAVLCHQYLNMHPQALVLYKRLMSLNPRPANWESIVIAIQHLEAEQNALRPAATNAAAPPTSTSAPLAVTSIATTNQTNTAAAPPVIPPVEIAKTNPPTPVVAVAPPPKPSAPVIPVAPVKPAPEPVVASHNPATVPTQPSPSPPAPVVTIDPAPVKPAPTPPTPPAPPVVVLPQTNVPTPVVFVPPVIPAPTIPPPVITPPVVAPATVSSPTNLSATAESKDAEKPGFLQKFNPFRRKTAAAPAAPRTTGLPKTTVLPSVTNDVRIPPVPAAPKPATPALMKPLEPISPPAPTFERYTFQHPAKPAPGNKEESDRLINLAKAAQTAKKNSEAVTQFAAAAQADPSSFDAQYGLGFSLYESGQFAKALSAYENALAITPTNPDARFNFALALRQANFLPDAAEQLDLYLKDNPDDALGHLLLANLYAQQLRQPDKARPHYKRVIEIAPKHPQALAIRQWLGVNGQ